MRRPSTRVLDLFAVVDAVEPIAGASSGSVRAGDLVLTPDPTPAATEVLAPELARLAVRLSEAAQGRRGLRIAIPVPARDGAWSVDGWSATADVPDTTACTDPGVLLAIADLLHAHLAAAVPRLSAPLTAALAARTDAATGAEAGAFDPGTLTDEQRRAAVQLLPLWRPAELGAEQLVHPEVGACVRLDARGAPIVTVIAPTWRPVRWARALLGVDATLSPIDSGAQPSSLALPAVNDERDRQAFVRAAIYRLLLDPDPRPERYRDALIAALG